MLGCIAVYLRNRTRIFICEILEKPYWFSVFVCFSSPYLVAVVCHGSIWTMMVCVYSLLGG
ncbi:hypothetical protein RchiOBHm_Chr1g0325101 [Rosa chinensis]|uniref:Uncharacterized protein n=1 Tax=Rosa chinensis TaxID=74649 RepID=A0A2P6S9Y6_ROSCH|nr:hypothetical protein RchiOBHm_Chr1g0325101 [Rosa chinensis]